MYKILLTLCLVAFVATSPIIKEINDDLKVDITVVEDIEEFKNTHPSLELTPLFSDELQESPFGVIRHTAGSRVAGDRLVASGSGGQSWATPQDVQLSLQYPKSGTGAVLSYVEVLVDQSSNVGEGFIISGGIGQRHIALVIQARSTTHFNYAAAFYGV
ncbi:uncharacterized protein LOC129612652 [Condylostylus longicornis]|uniref:uncharacterized protein LOC129612652 n=1 Tax=Condylostylus longicornis TaxID=2530218 RepID=UPI00244E5357|nr:uncharacterized protein LOC129612652 [Condylostylus longicornis]